MPLLIILVGVWTYGTFRAEDKFNWTPVISEAEELCGHGKFDLIQNPIRVPTGNRYFVCKITNVSEVK